MTKQVRLRGGPEFELIRRVAQQAGNHGKVLVGIGDDCAVLSDGQVISVDTSIEDVHFRRAWLEPRDIGYRAAAVALSDLAAMAATPTALFVAIALTRADYGDYADAVLSGVAECAHEFGAAVAGGDTSRTNGPLSLSISAVGHAEAPVLRSGARPGDSVWVTGRLGGASAAVQCWKAGGQPTESQQQAFRRPAPRIECALWLREQLRLNAMIDLSDGLIADAGHIAAASGLAVELRADHIPVAAGASLEQALGGGDDYELCFTAEDNIQQEVLAAFGQSFGIPLTRIGSVRAGQGVTVLDADQRTVNIVPGFDHFMAENQ